MFAVRRNADAEMVRALGPAPGGKLPAGEDGPEATAVVGEDMYSEVALLALRSGAGLEKEEVGEGGAGGIVCCC